MSTAEILSLISVISFVLSGLCLVLAVFFWIYFKIPTVIGDLSGRTAKKSIARIRQQNEKAGGQGFKPSAANVNRGMLTDTMQHSRKLATESKKKQQSVELKKKPAVAAQMLETGVLADNRAGTVDTQQTALLNGQETTGLLVDENATMPLQQEVPPAVKRMGGKQLTMLDDVVLIHTDEVIC